MSMVCASSSAIRVALTEPTLVVALTPGTHLTLTPGLQTRKIIGIEEQAAVPTCVTCLGLDTTLTGFDRQCRCPEMEYMFP